MPARVTVYCKRSVASLTGAALRGELDEADLMTLAESLELPEGEEAAVEAMLPHLRVVAEGAPFTYGEVHWKPAGRPIQIERVVDDAPAHLAELLEEGLPEARTAGAKRVAKHLRECQEIVYLELGIDDSMHLGATLAEVLAFYIAEQGDGLVWFYHREWASPGDRGKTLWTTEP
jgi:hypothetical protein